ncbi:MAG: radical SAM/SPASM domain-containing protein [Acetobacteraceae bacterium]
MAHPALETPPKLTIGITEACPLHCRHCYADCAPSPKSGELSSRQWITLINDLAAQGVIQVYFEGGEPLVKPGFVEILSTAASCMMTLLRTHGCGLSATMAQSLSVAGLGRALVDIMGPDAATHDAATGVAGSFVQACAAVRHLTSAGIPTDVLVVLTRDAAPRLNAIARLARDLGAERLGILRLYPLGRARQCWEEIALGLSEQMQALATLSPPDGLTIMQSWHPNDHNCCWQAAAINAFGRAIGCMYLREYVDFGDATKIRYNEIFRSHPLYRQLRSGNVEEHCESCSASQGTGGGCRSTAFAWYGRWTAPDPFDSALNHDVDLTRLPPERPHAGVLGA